MSKYDLFTYNLPNDRIADRPIYPPEAAKLLVINRSAKQLIDLQFTEITQFLKPSDLIVFNDTKVLPSRLFGVGDRGAKLELLLLRAKPEIENGFVCLGRPLKKFRPNTAIVFGPELEAQILARISESEVLVKFNVRSDGLSLNTLLNRYGSMPIPPYIRGGIADQRDFTDYQSVFAREEGSIAAPTASLHFSNALIDSIRVTGCEIGYLTLHLSTASFFSLYQGNSLEESEIRPPGEEYGRVSTMLAQKIANKKSSGGKVLAVGTSVVRALESFAANTSYRLDEFNPTTLFITPGYQFKIVDKLVTNFHQPGTTHLSLVEAILGRELLENAYRHALHNSYRFLSYGDGMAVL